MNTEDFRAENNNSFQTVDHERRPFLLGGNRHEKHDFTADGDTDIVEGQIMAFDTVTGKLIPFVPFGTGVVANITANQGVGADAAKPVTGLTIGEIYVSNDTFLKFTATGTTTWDAGVPLIDLQYIIDDTGAADVVYQYNGTALLTMPSGGATNVSDQNIPYGMAIKTQTVLDTVTVKMYVVVAGDVDESIAIAANTEAKVNSMRGSHFGIRFVPVKELNSFDN